MRRGEAPRFELRLLGSPQVLRSDGTAVDLPLGKPLAALYFLAVEPSAVRRSDLARILWPSSTEPRARASIRQALWLLRKHTDAEAIREIDGVLSIDPSYIGLDLDDLEAALAEGDLEVALELWRGGILRGFSVPDAKPWVAWADDVRHRWESRIGRAFEERAEASTGETRAEWFEHALAVRPYRVEAWQSLIRTRVELRDGEGADQALSRLRQVADADDAEAVRDAEERVRLLHRAEYGDPEERLVPDFVGRSEEFSGIMEAWRSALSGRPRVLGIVGPAGIGKTALADEAVRHVEVDEGAVVEARAVRTETTLDFGVVATLVADLLRRPGAAGSSSASAQVLRSLVPSEGDTAGPIPRPAALADALADVLDSVADEAPVLLVVDDAHWIDSASAVVLLRAFRQMKSTRALMIWTCGDANGAGAGASAGFTALSDAAAQGSATLLTLDPLSPPEVQEMITLLLSEAEPTLLASLAERIQLISGGSPLHIIELLQGMRDRGQLGFDEEGRGVLAEDIDGTFAELPDSLAEALLGRVLELTATAKLLGSELAAAGAPLGPESLESRTGLPKNEVTRALSELLNRGLVRWTRDDRLQLTHDTLGVALRAAEDEGPEAPTTRHRPRWPWMAAGLAAAAMAGFVLLRPGPAEEPPPFGGGTIWIRDTTGWAPVEYRGGIDPWVAGERFEVPEGVALQAFHTEGVGAEGPPILGGYTTGDPTRAPDAVIIRDGRVDTIVATGGDDSMRAFGPAGRSVLANAQHPDTSNYRQTTVRVDLTEPRRREVLFAGPLGYLATDWSADGRHILVVVDAAWDSLVVADPAGRRIAQAPLPHPGRDLAVFCGPEAVLLGAIPSGGLAEYWRWDFLTGSLAPLATSLEPAGPPTCSPDGSALAYLHSSAAGDALILETREGGVVGQMDLAESAAHRVQWLGARNGAVDVEISTPRPTLARGERARMGAIVTGGDGSALDRPIEWLSSAPGVASVDATGRVTGNRPGRAQIRARVDGWIEDSVQVIVEQEVAPNTLAFSDSFPQFDSSVWYGLGDPVPYALRTADGRPALYLNGDGRFGDGLASVDAFDLRGGGTLEATFRIRPFQRRDRERIMLCLRDGDPGPDPSNHADWIKRQDACVTWPTGEGVDFRPDAFLFTVLNRAVGAIPIDTLLQPERWQRLAVQIRPDGLVSATVNDSVVGVHPIRVRNDSTARWHAVVIGHSVDNELLLRDLTLWSEERVSAPVPETRNPTRADPPQSLSPSGG